MTKNEFKGHVAMLLANSLWGGMSPLAKTVMLGGVISPLVLTDLRITAAMICFWLLSFCLPREHVPHGDLFRLFFAALLGIVFNQGSFIFAVSLTSHHDYLNADVDHDFSCFYFKRANYFKKDLRSDVRCYRCFSANHRFS